MIWDPFVLIAQCMIRQAFNDEFRFWIISNPLILACTNLNSITGKIMQGQSAQRICDYFSFQYNTEYHES